MARKYVKEIAEVQEVEGEIKTLPSKYSIVETFENKTTYTMEYIDEQIALHTHKIQEWTDLKKEFEKLK